MNIVGGIFLIALGAYICARPKAVAGKLQRFYSNYPLVRHAGEEQLRSRNAFVVLLGIVFVALGALIIVFA